MSKYYIKKPIPIKAEPYTEGLEDGFEEFKIRKHTEDRIKKLVSHLDYLTYVSEEIEIYRVPYINTLEGKHYIKPDDYILTGVRGERYPCKKDIFEETYEEVVKSKPSPPSKMAGKINK